MSAVTDLLDEIADVTFESYLMTWEAIFNRPTAQYIVADFTASLEEDSPMPQFDPMKGSTE